MPWFEKKKNQEIDGENSTLFNRMVTSQRSTFTPSRKNFYKFNRLYK